MKVAYLLADPGIPVGGTKGASVHVAELCAALASRDAQVRLFAARVTGRAPTGTELVHLDAGPLAKGDVGLRIAAAEQFARRAHPAVTAFAPDLIYERLTLGYAGSARLAARLRVPRLVEVNAPVVDEWFSQHPMMDEQRVRHLEAQAIAGARIVAVSQPLADWAMSRQASAASVVANGVHVDRFLPSSPRREQLRAERGLTGCQVVGFVGSLKPWHGVDVLLDAVALIAADRPQLRVLVVGDGPRRVALEAQAGSLGLADKVTFVGAVPQQAVPDYLSAIDIATAPYIPTSQFYFSPLKVVEAMAAARPLVASRFGPVSELIADTGVLVPAGDPGALGRAVSGLLDDPATANQLGQLARRRAVRQLSWHRVVDETLAFGFADRLAAAGAVGTQSPGPGSRT